MYTRMIPILHVGDVVAERDFYLSLGFAIHVDPDEQYPETDFAALEAGPSILFGVSASSDFEARTAEARLWWQFETSDIDRVHELARAAAVMIEQPPRTEDWGRQTLKLRSGQRLPGHFSRRRPLPRETQVWRTHVPARVEQRVSIGVW